MLQTNMADSGTDAEHEKEAGEAEVVAKVRKNWCFDL